MLVGMCVWLCMWVCSVCESMWWFLGVMFGEGGVLVVWRVLVFVVFCFGIVVCILRVVFGGWGFCYFWV